MKRFLALILGTAMLASLTACGDLEKLASQIIQTPANDQTIQAPTEGSQADQTPTEGDQTIQVPTEGDQGDQADQAPTEEAILGVYSQADNTYENDFLGIGFQPGEGWEIWDEDQMAQLNGLLAEAITDEALLEILEDDGYVQVFYAQAQDGLLTANITVEDLGALYGALLDEQAYVELAQKQMAPALEAMGVSDITTNLGTATLAGAEHAAIFIHGTFQGVEFYETVVCVRTGDYVANITAASYLSDATQDILDLFYAL